MDEVELKFNNLKKFICETAPHAKMLGLFMVAPLDLFLQHIRAEYQKDMTVAEISQKIMDLAGVNRKDFTEEQITRFELYIEYFIWKLQC